MTNRAYYKYSIQNKVKKVEIFLFSQDRFCTRYLGSICHMRRKIKMRETATFVQEIDTLR